MSRYVKIVRAGYAGYRLRPVLGCDQCRKEISLFKAASSGWLTVSLGKNGYHHYCPRCAADSSKK
jgi:hypothetical protein